MADNLIRIQCMRCRTDIVFVNDNGKIEEEAGWISSGAWDSISVRCDKCNYTFVFQTV